MWTYKLTVDSWCHYLSLMLMWNDFTIVIVACVHDLSYTWAVDLCVIKCVRVVQCTVYSCTMAKSYNWSVRNIKQLSCS